VNNESIEINIAADPIIIFGRSPIKVAAPPMFEANAWAIINGIGESLNILNTETVTGTISKIIVTLSINIETTAVKVHKINNNFRKLPPLILLAFIPTNWNTPD